MSTGKRKIQTTMSDHSKAKVELYGKYLSVYLNVLSRNPYVDKIFLFDLMAGEGIYQNGECGSPLIALESIKNHCFSNNQKCPEIEIWLNDSEQSKIEPGVFKIDRVKRFAEDIFTPDSVNIKYYREDYRDLLPKAIKAVNSTRKSKGLFFIDPYGYKEIDPKDIKRILHGRQSEMLLFMPSTHMYRFAESSLESDFSGSEALREFIQTLFERSVPSFSSPHDFILKLKAQFEYFLGYNNHYVATFKIERNPTTTHCLFFFTTNIRGLEKMLEAIWNLDALGEGHRRDTTPMMFSRVELDFDQKLIDFISSSEICTNYDIYEFSLRNGFLPKHAKEVLDRIPNLETVPLDGKPNRGYYIKYKSDRRIQFKIIGNKD